jgi:hypothetical protein
VADPDNELVHLYEIRDAAAKHYGGKAPALKALGIPQAEWNELDRLANAEPLREGRHRGKHNPGLRKATKEERTQARAIARSIIRAFAALV